MKKFEEPKIEIVNVSVDVMTCSCYFWWLPHHDHPNWIEEEINKYKED